MKLYQAVEDKSVRFAPPIGRAFFTRLWWRGGQPRYREYPGEAWIIRMPGLYWKRDWRQMAGAYCWHRCELVIDLSGQLERTFRLWYVPLTLGP